MNIKIVPYQDSWRTDFREIAAALRQGLGPLALRIDHIGSTSVPGLAAKDIIDIQVSVAALNPPLLTAITTLGYIREEQNCSDHRPALAGGADSEWEKWYFEQPPDRRRIHIHVRVAGRSNQRYPLLFRDYLRTHPATAAAYAELKRRLAANLADAHTYPEVKDPAVDLIYLAAEEWAAATNWQIGASDA